MLSYQHIYHAGNFADVHKHAILIRLLKTLKIKPARMAVLDTHAGRGIYDLQSDEALKTGEAAHGAQAIMSQNASTGIIADYRAEILRHNPEGELRRYPGTAQIARDLLRDTDRLICIEKHPGEFAQLHNNLSHAPQTVISQEDGFEALAHYLPFAERRGLVVIDPSYEIKSEYLDLPRYLEKAYRKWPQGVYMIWYPMMDMLGDRHMLAALRATGIKDILISEVRLDVPPEAHYRMHGTGIAIINAPWPEAVMNDITQQIVRALPAKAFGDVYWLDNKKIDPDTGMLER